MRIDRHLLLGIVILINLLVSIQLIIILDSSFTFHFDPYGMLIFILFISIVPDLELMKKSALSEPDNILKIKLLSLHNPFFPIMVSIISIFLQTNLLLWGTFGWLIHVSNDVVDTIMHTPR
jgi:hypothetical protein